ncbi:hypothetical protein QM012_006150 [Aureobasidium pullulans]|uniref:SET domain-containing protein n=1 Tax=Aureobasidium pullulans TaxID=5580 RepID=A0ABR0TRU1_AURPU
MDVKSAQDQMCALASQFATLAGLGEHSDPALQRHLAIRITDALRQELVLSGAIQPNHPPTIWDGGVCLGSLRQSPANTLDPAVTEGKGIRTEIKPDRMEIDEEDMDTSENVDQPYLVELSQEVLAVNLHKRILDASDSNTKTVEPQFKATLPMVETLRPLMIKALTTYWNKELRQAEVALAAIEEDGGRQAPQTLGLAEYCRQPQPLAERDNAGDFDGAVKSIKNIVQDQRDMTYARQGMKSWVWPLMEKYCIKTKLSKEAELANEELLYMALGERFPKGYGDYKFTQQDIESHGLQYQRPEKEATDKGYAANPAATLGPWIETFGSLPAELSSRAFSRAGKDYSGRREARFFKNIPQEARENWQDFRTAWISSSDLALIVFANPLQRHLYEEVAFHSKTPDTVGVKRQPIEELANNEVTLKYGYRGFRNDNYSWSITIRDDSDGNPRAFSTVPIKAGSFLGFLPGHCRFNPEMEDSQSEEFKRCIESDRRGLFLETENCYGLLGCMEKTKIGAEGNVIGGWEQFTDDLGSDSMPWCIVMFAYRDIPALTPLVFWDHLRYGWAEDVR